MNPPLLGTWFLTAALSIVGEIPRIGEETDPDGVNAWLYGNSTDLLGQAKPISGLMLRIDDNGTFTEKRLGNLRLWWFDNEGVLDETVTPFDGIIQTEGEFAYLLLSQPISWATPTEPLRKARVRYDDGDTIICDKLELMDERLVRTMSVVTDELYLNRTVLIYERVSRTWPVA